MSTYNPTEYESRLVAITQAIREEFGGLDPKALNWKPTPKTWSIAQVLDHLMMVNTSYFSYLDQIAAGEHPPLSWTGRLGPVRRWLGKLILKGVAPSRQSRVSTFSAWEPTTYELPPDTVDAFVHHQAQLWEKIAAVLPRLGEGYKVPSPASSAMAYNLEDALEILVTHEERHLNQAREVYQIYQSHLQDPA